MEFKLKIPRLILNFLTGAAWTVLFWLAVTRFDPKISFTALVALIVLTISALADRSAPQLGLNIAYWFAGGMVSAYIEIGMDFAHILLPEWNAGNGLGVIGFIPLFIIAGSLTIFAAVIASGVKRRKQ